MTFHVVDGGFWLLALLPTLLWVLILVLGIVIVVRLANRDRTGQGYRVDSAEEILRRRFAAGEIDADEYARRLEMLRRR